MTTLLAPDTDTSDREPRTARRTPARRVRIGGPDPELVTHVVGAAVGALGLNWMIYERLIPMTGAIAKSQPIRPETVSDHVAPEKAQPAEEQSKPD